MLKFALIIGSTRPNRFADRPARWVADRAKTLSEFELDVHDLRDQALPFFEEPAPPAASRGRFTNPAAIAWDAKLAGYDGFIMTVAEYNHGMTAVMKNALDSAFNGWKNKPVGFVGYGGTGGARAVEAVRLSAISLQMAPISAAVHIPIQAYVSVIKEGASLASFDYLNESLVGMFKQLVWWADALKAARAKQG